MIISLCMSSPTTTASKSTRLGLQTVLRSVHTGQISFLLIVETLLNIAESGQGDVHVQHSSADALSDAQHKMPPLILVFFLTFLAVVFMPPPNKAGALSDYAV